MLFSLIANSAYLVDIPLMMVLAKIAHWVPTQPLLEQLNVKHATADQK